MSSTSFASRVIVLISVITVQTLVYSELLERDAPSGGAEILHDPVIVSTLCGSTGAVYLFLMAALTGYRTHLQEARHERRAQCGTV